MKEIGKRIWADVKNYYIGIIALLIYSVIVRNVFHAFCPLLIITGFPCAGCGMTRAMYCIMTGQFVRAADLNPAAFFWLLWFIFFAIERYILGRNSKWVMLMLGGVCAITLIIYLYRMTTQFPGTPPMTFYRKNVLSKYSTFYRNLLQYMQKL